MGVALGMQPPWGLAATTLFLILVAHITSNVALRVDPATEEFPLLMPRVHPHQAESYLCTPIRVDTDVAYSITGFKPNATKMTAHHMLIYGCEEPGDVVAARCTMVNTRDRTTFVGATKEDEMCNFYIMYWVEGDSPMDQTTCFSRGPPTWSWGGWAGLNSGLASQISLILRPQRCNWLHRYLSLFCQETF